MSFKVFFFDVSWASEVSTPLIVLGFCLSFFFFLISVIKIIGLSCYVFCSFGDLNI